MDRARRGVSGALSSAIRFSRAEYRSEGPATGVGTPREALTARSRATQAREPGQVRKEAALSENYGCHGEAWPEPNSMDTPGDRVSKAVARSIFTIYVCARPQVGPMSLARADESPGRGGRPVMVRSVRSDLGRHREARKAGECQLPFEPEPAGFRRSRFGPTFSRHRWPSSRRPSFSPGSLRRELTPGSTGPTSRPAR